MSNMDNCIQDAMLSCKHVSNITAVGPVFNETLAKAENKNITKSMDLETWVRGIYE